MSTSPRKKSTVKVAAFTKNAWAPKNRRAKMVGEFVPNLMRPAFEKFGFPAATILTNWAAVAGPEFAAFTAPERLKWPRKTVNAEGTVSEKGATLVLRVAGARALEVEQMRPQLVNRINASFGFRAVSEIRIIQAPLPKARSQKRPAPPPLSPIEQAEKLSTLPDGPLKQSFARMAAGLKARNAGNKAPAS